MQRIYIYGQHTPYRVGEVERGELDVLAAKDQRGALLRALSEIQARREDRRLDLWNDFFTRFGPNPPVQILSAHRRAIRNEIARYEQELLREFANVEIRSAAPWGKVVGIWVAS